MRAINLLPTQTYQAKKERTGLAAAAPLIAAGAVPVACLALVVFGYTSGHSVVTAKTAQLAELQAELTRVQPAPVTASTPSPDAATLVAQRTARLTALQDALGKEVAWDAALGDMARVLPENVWLTSLNATSPTPADTATATATPAPPASGSTSSGAGLTLSGLTYTEADVAMLLQRLQLLPTLDNVTLTSATQSAVGKKALVQFSITATVQPADGAAATTTPATTVTPTVTTTTTPAESTP